MFHHQMKHCEESWKYDGQRSIFDELWDVSSGDEHCVKWLILLLKQNDFRRRNQGCKHEQFFIWFPNTHWTLISSVFSLWIINEFEKDNEQHTLQAVEKESGRHYISLNQLTFVFVLQTANSEMERFSNDLEKWFWCLSVFFVVVVLLANGWKDQNIASSISHQRKP